LFEQEMLIAGTGAAAETTITTKAINGIHGTRIKLVQGDAGSVAGLLALERGEVDGGFPTLEALHTLHPEWLRDNTLNLLFQLTEPCPCNALCWHRVDLGALKFPSPAI
jgi:hypothetical protein